MVHVDYDFTYSNSRRRAMAISSNVRPATSTSALGRSFVSDATACPARRPESSPSFAQLLHLNVPHQQSRPCRHGNAARASARYTSGAGRRCSQTYHQAIEATLLVVFHAGFYHRRSAGQVLANACLCAQIIDYRLSLPVRDLKRSSRPGFGSARASKMNPPPCPLSSFSAALR